MTTRWSIELQAGVSGAPVNDGERIFLSLRTAQVVALSAKDGREIWRVAREVNAPMASAGGLLFISAADAIEALRGTNGARAWIAPRLKATSPLVTAGDVLIVTTEAEVVALKVADGSVAWRVAAGGVRTAPAADAPFVFVGANDGRLAALRLDTGAQAWEQFVDGGVVALAAHRGRVYAAGGDKQLYCLDARSGARKWPYRIGAIPIGPIAVDDEHVYFTALDNVVRALDRETGNQRWQAPLSRRPLGGVYVAGHLVFLQVSGSEVIMLLARTGVRSGILPLPAETTRDTPPDVRQTAAGLNVVVASGGLSNQWHLTLVGPGSELALTPFSEMRPLPGLGYLTDPWLAPIARVLPWLVTGDPILRPLSTVEWPLVLRDPPLEPLTTIPGLQLRPLSPVLPVRRGA